MLYVLAVRNQVAGFDKMVSKNLSYIHKKDLQMPDTKVKHQSLPL